MVSELNWEKIYRIWINECDCLYPFIQKKLNMTEIKVSSSKGNHIEGVTWWPSEELKGNKQLLEKDFSNIQFINEPNSGQRKTVELLWQVKEDPEGIALAWIAASMWNKRGIRSSVVSKILAVTLSELQSRYKFSKWHHLSKKVLPISLDKELNLFDVKLGEMELYSLISMAAIESSLINSHYTIVHLYS